MPAKAIGVRGSWFAKVNGETLPCVHKHWFKAQRYDDPYAKLGDYKFEELAAALRESGRAILTDDEVGKGTLSFKRKGYIAVYAISEVEFDGAGLRFRFDQRLESLI